MTWVQAMLASGGATIRRPRWWLVALAGFLVRGGPILLLPVMLVLPTPAQIGAGLDPSLTGAAPGDLTPALLALAAKAVLLLAAGLLLTTLVGSWLEAALIDDVAAAAELGQIRPTVGVPLGRAVAVRLAAHLPTLVAVLAGGLVLAGATYAELISPSSTGSLPGRVIARAPGAGVLIVVAWLAGEAWGGMAVRRLGGGASLLVAVGGGIGDLLRLSGLATLALTTGVVGMPVVVLWLAAGRAFDRLWPLLVDRADPAALVVAASALAGTWAVGLSVLAIALAFRSVAWTAEALRGS